MNDHYGNEIAVDKLVAYNYQGEIRIGFVTEVKTAMRYGRLSDLILVSEVRGEPSKASRVTSRKNLVVIEQPGPRERVRIQVCG